MSSIRSLASRLATLALLPLSLSAAAHVDWDRVNDVDPDCLALYHFDDHTAAPGDTIAVEAGLPADRGLLVGATAGAGTVALHDTPEPIFDPHSLQLNSTQDLQSPGSIPGVDGDLTIEFWFKWDTTLTTQTLTLGLQSTASVVIARDAATPANDRFGLEFTHGDFVSAPGFTNWVDAGASEASLGEWRHYGVTIHSTGQTFNAGSGHDEYNAGSTAIFWLNGHATGTAPHKADIADMRAHDASRLRVRPFDGTVFVDEFTIWSKDWSEDGAVAAPFADGRGDGLPAAVAAWSLYE